MFQSAIGVLQMPKWGAGRVALVVGRVAADSVSMKFRRHTDVLAVIQGVRRGFVLAYDFKWMGDLLGCLHGWIGSHSQPGHNVVVACRGDVALLVPFVGDRAG